MVLVILGGLVILEVLDLLDLLDLLGLLVPLSFALLQ